MRWWVPGDWNGFFGLGTNVLVNLMVLTGLLKFVIQLPDTLLFGRILPAIGLMLFLGNMYYAWMAKRLIDPVNKTNTISLGAMSANARTDRIAKAIELLDDDLASAEITQERHTRRHKALLKELASAMREAEVEAGRSG